MVSESRDRILLTGCLGFVGKNILYHLMTRDETTIVYALVRSKRGQSGEDRFARMLHTAAFFPTSTAKRCRIVDCDLESMDTSGLPSDVVSIIHCAASVSFDLPPAKALRINLEPSVQLLKWAISLGRAVHFVYISTAYVCPEHDGRPRLVDGGDDPRFERSRAHHKNTYTWSKAITERTLWALQSDAVPLTIVRPSIVGPALRRPHEGFTDSKAAMVGMIWMYGMGVMQTKSQCGSVNIVPVDRVSELVLSSLGGPRETILHATEAIEMSVEHIADTVSTKYSNTTTIQGVFCSNRFWIVNKALHPLFCWTFDRLPLTLLCYLGRSKRAASILAAIDAQIIFGDTKWNFCSHLPQIDPIVFKNRYLEQLPNHVLKYIHKYDKRQVDMNAPSHTPTLLLAFAPQLVLACLLLPLVLFDSSLWSLAWILTTCWIAARCLRFRWGYTVVWRAFAAIIRVVFRKTFDRIEVDMLAMESIDWSKPTVVCATHRSYFDFLLLPYLFFQFDALRVRRIRIVADGAFLRIPILGRWLKWCGAVGIQRKCHDPSLGDVLSKVLTPYTPLLLFPEGTRSRTGETLPLKSGVFRSLAHRSDIQYVPLTIEYERVFEHNTFKSQLANGGAAAVPFNAGGFVRSCASLLLGGVQLGSVRIRVGQPTSESDVRTHIRTEWCGMLSGDCPRFRPRLI